MKKIACTMLVVVGLSGCGNADHQDAEKLKAQVIQLQSENSALKAELDSEKNGPARLLSTGRAALEEGSRERAEKAFQQLIARHPESPQAQEAKTAIAAIAAKRLEEAQAKKAEQEKKAEADRIAAAQAEKNLKRSVDEVRGIVWLSHKSEPFMSDYVSLYFGTEQSSAASYPLRLKLHYFGDDWLFVQSVTIKADDQTFNLGGLDFSRDNTGGSVWEWSDAPLSNRPMIDKVIASKKVIVRFNGRQYYKDFILPDAQKLAMKEIIAAWKAHGGKDAM
ncbi:hypothetical protein [Pseudomonas sp. S2_H01]